MFRFATLHAIQIIGEAASKVAPEARAAVPGIPWAALVGMRNRLVHAYFDVDTDILWETLKSSVPMLIDELSRVEVLDAPKLDDHGG